MSNLVRGLDDKRRESSINDRSAKSARGGYEFSKFKKTELANSNTVKQYGKGNLPQKKITVSDAMKPNSYLFSKKQSASNARSAKNSSPLDWGLIKNFAKKITNPFPKKESIAKPNNNKNNSKLRA